MFSEMLEISNTEGTSFATASNAYKVYERDHDSDIFEGVIDGLILEKYADQDLKDYIKDLPSNKKRVAALLSIGDDNVLWSKINEIIKEEKSGYERLKAVYTLLKLSVVPVAVAALYAWIIVGWVITIQPLSK